MLAWLSGLKVYLYGAVIALLLIGICFIYYRGEQHMEQQQAALNAAAAALNQAAGALAERKESQIVLQYQTDISAPAPVNSPGLVCHNEAKLQPHAAAYRPEITFDTETRTDGLFNPSGALRLDARESDAQIKALIATVHVLESELRGTTK